ncbi:MAG: hypothetical protein AAF547_09920 [Actinomycetota bacterium]
MAEPMIETAKGAVRRAEPMTARAPWLVLAALSLVAVVVVGATSVAAARPGSPPDPNGVAEAPVTSDGPDGPDGPDGTECPQLPPTTALGFAVTDLDDGGDPGAVDCPEPAAEPQIEATPTTEPAVAAVDAVDDEVVGQVDEAIDPVDLVANDSVQPAIGVIEIIDGALPDGLTLWLEGSLQGWVIGTPTECGSFQIDYRVESATLGEFEAEEDTATAIVEIACDPSTVPIEAADDEIEVGIDERLELDVVANDEPAAGVALVRLMDGELPDGLTLWAGGWLTGTPTEAGTFTISYEAGGPGGRSVASVVIEVGDAAVDGTDGAAGPDQTGAGSIRDGRRLVSPIGIDLDGSGRVDRVDAPVRIDLDGDGVIDTVTQWFAPGEGILLSTDAVAPSGWTLFGDQGGRYPDGFAKLAERDLDGDGVIAGPELRGLIVWRDRDGDAAIDPGEAAPIHRYGIVELPTTHRDLVAFATTGAGPVVIEDLWFPVLVID